MEPRRERRMEGEPGAKHAIWTARLQGRASRSGAPEARVHNCSSLRAGLDTRQLPPELLERILACVEKQRDVLSLRLACRALRQPAADAIRTLAPAGPELELPAEAWAVFRRADRLAIVYDPAGGPLDSHEIAKAWQVVQACPAHVTSLAFPAIPDGTPEQAIAGIPAAATLAELHMQSYITDGQADALLRSLPTLRRLRLRVEQCFEVPGEITTWEPEPPPGLTLLHLDLIVCDMETDSEDEEEYDMPISIDLAAVAALPALQELCVRFQCVSYVRGVPALAQLQQLTRLVLDHLHGEWYRSFACHWQLVSQLPSLREATVPCITLPPAAGQQQPGEPAAGAAVPQLTSLTSLRTRRLAVGSWPQPAGPPATPAFSLAQALPRLQHLELRYTEGQRLESWAALLQAHPQLTSLELVLEDEPHAQGSQQLAALLQSLPRLTQLSINSHSTDSLMLAACAAGLPGLRKLRLQGPCWVIALPLHCAWTGLQQLELRGTRMGAAALSALLGGGLLPGLQAVQLQLEKPLMEQDGAALEQLAHQLPSPESDSALLALTTAVADSGELVQALADAAVQQVAPAAAAAAPGRPRTRAAAAAARAAEQQLLQRWEAALQKLATRLREGASGQPLLPEQEATVLLQRVRQQLLLRERLALQMGRLALQVGLQLAGIRLERVELDYRGCSIEVCC